MNSAATTDKEMTMQGLYLYCLRERTDPRSPVSATGVDGKGEAFVVPYRALEAVVSEVSLDEFDSEEIQKKAREDLNWIKEKSVAHERVIEAAMTDEGRAVSVIPMRFGTIFKGNAQLEETLGREYPKIGEVLDRIRDKQEWSVKAYLMDRERFERAVKENSEAIKEKEGELASLPEGMAFFMEEELKQTIAREADRELDAIVGGLFDRLAGQSVASVRNRLLAKELTGRRAMMVLNSAHLVREKRVESFKREVEELTRQHAAQGLALDPSGPWPAFNFTSY
jgi:hypothetical protein